MGGVLRTLRQPRRLTRVEDLIRLDLRASGRARADRGATAHSNQYLSMQWPSRAPPTQTRAPDGRGVGVGKWEVWECGVGSGEWEVGKWESGKVGK